jgi:hypothetical protein
MGEMGRSLLSSGPAMTEGKMFLILVFWRLSRCERAKNEGVGFVKGFEAVSIFGIIINLRHPNLSTTDQSTRGRQKLSSPNTLDHGTISRYVRVCALP